jgi:hypothetical protein
MYLLTWESSKSAKKALARNCRSTDYLGKVRKSDKLSSPQTCGFAICGTCLRTAHFCYLLYKYVKHPDLYLSIVPLLAEF